LLSSFHSSSIQNNSKNKILLFNRIKAFSENYLQNIENNVLIISNIVLCLNNETK